MTQGDSLVIRTPEGIDFRLPLAGPFTRMLALGLDAAVISMLGWVLKTLLGSLSILGTDVAGAIYVVGGFVISLVYAATTEWLWRGQTVGKRVFGLRVVDARGLRLEPSQVIVRNLMRFIDVLPALYLTGGVACFLSARRQRLGDLAAGTVVIRATRSAPRDLDQLLSGKYNSLAESRHLAARLRQKTSAEVAHVALEAVARRDRLDPEARLRLFRELSMYFQELAPYPAEVVEQLSDEQYVRNVVEILFESASMAGKVH